MLINETWIDRTRNVNCGESGPYEPYTDDLGRLFRSLQREYGRCMSKMYIDRKDGQTLQVGWVFEKRTEYQDAWRLPKDKRTYLAETWVEFVQKVNCPCCGVLRYQLVDVRTAKEFEEVRQ